MPPAIHPVPPVCRGYRVSCYPPYARIQPSFQTSQAGGWWGVGIPGLQGGRRGLQSLKFPGYSAYAPTGGCFYAPWGSVLDDMGLHRLLRRAVTGMARYSRPNTRHREDGTGIRGAGWGVGGRWGLSGGVRVSARACGGASDRAVGVSQGVRRCLLGQSDASIVPRPPGRGGGRGQWVFRRACGGAFGAVGPCGRAWRGYGWGAIKCPSHGIVGVGGLKGRIPPPWRG